MIVLVNTDPTNGPELGAPFFQATVAAALEYEVEVIFSGRAGELAIRGVAETLFVQPGAKRSVYDYIRAAHEAGVRFRVCTPAVELYGEDLIPEIEETVGGAYVITNAMDDNTVTFTY